MNINIKACLPSDLDVLTSVAYETYNDTFKNMNSQETMEKYLTEAFDRAKMLSELQNMHSRFFFLYADGALAGYLKVNEAPAQSDIQDEESLEIERIYIRKEYKGKGLGAHLMEFALNMAHDEGKRFAWLGVWEKNSAAIAFYQKMGFKIAGRHTFRMGDELQSDFVMKKVFFKKDDD